MTEHQKHLNNILKKCKSRTGMMVPCIVHKLDLETTHLRVGIVGKGFIIYNSLTMQISYNIVDHEGNELPAEYYSIEQEEQKAFLVVYSGAVN